MLSKTAQNAINAYGGIELWQKAKYIEAEVSVKGLVFTLKRRAVFNHAKIFMEIHHPFSKITPIGKAKNISGVFNFKDVYLEDHQGNIISSRKNPRNYFPFGRRLLYWDDLDMAYFANYAFWNYFTMPNLLLNSEINWTEVEDGILKAVFPDNFPTHSKIQHFYFDTETGLLKQHNYNADVVTTLATAANVIHEHQKFGNYHVASKRKVTPRNKKGKPLNFPLLVDIDVHDFKMLKDDKTPF